MFGSKVDPFEGPEAYISDDGDPGVLYVLRPGGHEEERGVRVHHDPLFLNWPREGKRGYGREIPKRSEASRSEDVCDVLEHSGLNS